MELTGKKNAWKFYFELMMSWTPLPAIFGNPAAARKLPLQEAMTELPGLLTEKEFCAETARWALAAGALLSAKARPAMDVYLYIWIYVYIKKKAQFLTGLSRQIADGQWLPVVLIQRSF